MLPHEDITVRGGQRSARAGGVLICYHFKFFDICSPHRELPGMIDGDMIDCD